MSFRSRLFFSFLLLATLIVAGSILTVNRQFSEGLRQDVFAELARTPERFASMQASSMNALITQGENVSSSPILRGALSTNDRPTIIEAVEEINGLYSYDLFWVLDTRGRVIYRANEPQAWDDRIDQLPAVRDAFNGYDSGDLWMHGDMIYEVAASPVRAGSQWLGILVIGEAFDGDQDQGIAHEFATLAHLEVAFAPEDTVCLASLEEVHGFALKQTFKRKSEEARANGRDLPAVPWTRTGPDVEMPPAPTFEFDVAGVPYAGALFELNNVRNHRIAHAMVFQAMTPLRELKSRVRQGLLLVGIGAMLLALLVAYALSRGLTRPVDRLVMASKRLGRGDLETAVPHQSSDEIGALGTALDEMRVSLREARAEALKNEALSTIGRMASTITHDFRQPITSIYGYIQLITLPSADRETQQEFAERIIQQIDRMQGMINELLDYSRGEYVLRPQDIVLSEFLERVRENYAVVARDQNIEVEVELNWDGHVRLDRDRFERVLDNLVRNAVQAMESNGEVRLTATREGDRLELKVIDTGPGIPAEIRENLFDAFVTHGKAGGTGLGLAVARRVVEEHGGNITVESEMGVGTTFILSIPLTQPAQESA